MRTPPSRCQTRLIINAAAAGTTLLLGMSGCGLETSRPPSPRALPQAAAGRAELDPASSVTITIDAAAVARGARAFGENPLSIPPGTVVTWINQDSAPHAIAADRGGDFESPPIPPGKSYSHAFGRSGDFPYHCKVAGAAAMSGRIVVANEAASDRMSEIGPRHAFDEEHRPDQRKHDFKPEPKPHPKPKPDRDLKPIDGPHKPKPEERRPIERDRDRDRDILPRPDRDAHSGHEAAL